MKRFKHCLDSAIAWVALSGLAGLLYVVSGPGLEPTVVRWLTWWFLFLAGLLVVWLGVRRDQTLVKAAQDQWFEMLPGNEHTGYLFINAELVVVATNAKATQWLSKPSDADQGVRGRAIDQLLIDDHASTQMLQQIRHLFDTHLQ